jgi:hypothetical protein
LYQSINRLADEVELVVLVDVLVDVVELVVLVDVLEAKLKSILY